MGFKLHSSAAPRHHFRQSLATQIASLSHLATEVAAYDSYAILRPSRKRQYDSHLRSSPLLKHYRNLVGMKFAFCSQRLTPGCDEQSRFNDEEQNYVASSRRSHEGLHVDAVSLFNTDVPSADTLPQQAKASWSAAKG